jgi:hypothetical protein
MKRCRVVFLALEISWGAYWTSAAEYPAASAPGPPNNLPSPPFRIEAGTPAGGANTNQASPQAGESELRIEFKLLSALAQEHRQRAEAAARSDQAQRAKWEMELAEELQKRGSSILAQLQEVAARRPMRLSGAPAEASGPLSPAEADYLAKIHERLQAVQQELAAATEEIKFYALQAVTNRDTIEYGYNSPSMQMQLVTRDLRRLQAEQAELDLKTSQFWALHASIRNAQKASGF